MYNKNMNEKMNSRPLPPEVKVEKSLEDMKHESGAVLAEIGKRNEHSKKLVAMLDEAVALYDTIAIDTATNEYMHSAQERIERMAESVQGEYADSPIANEIWQDMQQLILLIKKMRKNRGDQSEIDYGETKQQSYSAG